MSRWHRARIDTRFFVRHGATLSGLIEKSYCALQLIAYNGVVTGTQHLGVEINNARIERWWSLSSLAEYLEIPSHYLHAIERGELLPSDDLAKELRMWLVSDEEIERVVRSLLSDSELDPV